MKLTAEDSAVISKLILDVAKSIVGHVKDNGRMAIHDPIIRDQFLITCPRLIHNEMKALDATLIALLEGTIEDNKEDNKKI